MASAAAATPRLSRAAGDGDRQGDADDQRSNGVHIGLLVCAALNPERGQQASRLVADRGGMVMHVTELGQWRLV